MTVRLWLVVLATCFWSVMAFGQLTDRTQAPNTAKAGIAKSLQDETGSGRGDVMSWNSSIFIIQRDPFRSIRRGRQLFQRKFTRLQGQGANEGDGSGDLNTDGAIGAGLTDSVQRVMAVPGAQRVPEETSPPGRIAAMLPISLGWASRKCSPTRLPLTCEAFVNKP